MALSVSATSATAAAQAPCTGPESKTRLYVNVEGLRSAQGLVAVTLYADDPKRFLAHRGSLYVGRVPARAPVTRVCIYVPEPGTYGLAVYHDADSSRRINRSPIGTPAEGFGFSNNASTLFGIPSFKAVRLAVPRSDMETRVKLKYP
jgi:uncharacterized protein (DUF2141 family)